MKTENISDNSVEFFLNFKGLAVAVLFVIACLILSLLIPTSARAQSSTAYKGGFQQQSSVVKAEVMSVRDVTLSLENSQTGLYAGQAIGGLVGVLLGKNSNNYAVTGVITSLATMAGGAVGSRMGSEQAAQEIILNFADGRLSAVTQSVSDGIRFARGQQVMVIGNGRVAPL